MLVLLRGHSSFCRSWKQGFLKYGMIENNSIYNLWKNHDFKQHFSNHLCQGHNLHQITGLMGNAILRNHLK